MHKDSKPSKTAAEPKRDTRQRRAIRRAIKDAGRPLSPTEIHEAAAANVDGLGQATVYRAINDMLEAGDIVEVALPGENNRYELAGLDHHHHFHCTTCDRVFDVQGCPGALGSLLPEGFELDDHEITLYGACKDCLAAS